MGCVPRIPCFRCDEERDTLSQRLLEHGTHDTTLPAPGELVAVDYRPVKSNPPVESGTPMRVVQWNIERGYQLEAIKAELAALNADVVLIQEVDIGCDRSNNADVGDELARALGMNYVFLCEFIEYRSTAREASAQGGGVHGNAILTRYDIRNAESIEHQHHPVDWNSDTHEFARKEPRCGRRLTLGATLDTPFGLMQVYTVHLEVFCGPLGRMRQFADVLDHSRAAALAGIEVQIIGGDLNTMGHGVARVSPYHCTDHLRWRTVGRYEADIWDENLFSVFSGDLRSPKFNDRIWNLGLHDHGLCTSLTNPGFSEVFDLHEATLDHPSFRLLGISLMEGKLDWLLHRGGLYVKDRTMGNGEYHASDHKWLAADFVKPELTLTSCASLHPRLSKLEERARREHATLSAAALMHGGDEDGEVLSRASGVATRGELGRKQHSIRSGV